MAARMVLECCSSICGRNDSTPSAAKPRGSELNRNGVRKPVLRSDDAALEASTENLMARFGLQVAPPNADPPVALVSQDFRKNNQRLLVLLPTMGSSFASWDTDLPDGRGASFPIIQWAEANDYAIALFSAAALAANPAEAWDRILFGSPARHVVAVVAARGALAVLHEALLEVHELLYGRVRIVCMPWDLDLPAASSPSAVSSLPRKPKELRAHFRQAQIQWPAEWAALEPNLMRQRFFEMLKEKEDQWQAQEAAKYMGLGQLKENDIPGLKRIGIEQRVQRINRDRDTDELSRLIKKHHGEKKINGDDEDDAEEPGID